VKYANCGASTKANTKVKKMNAGGFMKIGDGLQKLDVNKEDKLDMNRGGMAKKPKAYSSGGMAEKKRKDKSDDEGKKGAKKSKRGELVEASYGKTVRKKKK